MDGEFKACLYHYHSHKRTLFFDSAEAKQYNIWFSQQLRLAEGISRITESEQLADSVNLWGNISAHGRNVVPGSTRAHELIFYACCKIIADIK